MHPVAAGLIAAACSLFLGAVGDTRMLVAPVAVVWGLAMLASRTPGPARWESPLAWAIAVRLPLLLCAPTLSDDVFRYVWEGEVWRAGMNPFVLPPDDPALTSLRDAIWTQVNHRHVPSVYPPLAQLLFAVVPSVMGWRLLTTACDLVTVELLSRRDARAGWLWALLPLPALESAVSGHLEGIGVMLLVAAMGGRGWAAWLGAMVKLLPGVLLVRRWRWLIVAAVSFTMCIPLLRPDGFAIYRDSWAYNGSLFPLVEARLGALARPLLHGVGALVVASILVRSRDDGRIALWASGAFVILSPVVHPWYVLWPLAAGLWNGMRAWTLLGALVPLSYVVLATYDPATSSWTEPIWTRWAIYVPFYLALAWESWTRLTRPGPAGVG